jgi:hypothetical protein
MVNSDVSYIDSIVFLVMFGILVVLFYAYAFEYVRYRTIKPPPRRKLNKWLLGWIVLMGVYSALRLSPLLALIIWGIDALIYLWDKYMGSQKL